MGMFDELLREEPEAVQVARKTLAEYARYPMFAEDMWETSQAVKDGADPPQPGSRLPAAEQRFKGGGLDWDFRGWLRTTVKANVPAALRGAILGRANSTYIGALFRKGASDDYLVVLRGTEGLYEWIQNCLVLPDIGLGNAALMAAEVEKAPAGVPMTLHLPPLRWSRVSTDVCLAVARGAGELLRLASHFFPLHPSLLPVGGFAPEGFHSMFTSMTYKDLPAVEGVLAEIASDDQAAGALHPGATVTVVGHSLGAALATYFCAELARTTKGRQPLHVKGVFFATPPPASQEFADALDGFGEQLDYVSLVYDRDVVPLVPPAPYQPLNRTVHLVSARSSTLPAHSIRAAAGTADGLPDNHHAICYAAMLDPAVSCSTEVTEADADCVRSITTDKARPERYRVHVAAAGADAAGGAGLVAAG